MSGGTRIIAFDSASAGAADDEILLTEEVQDVAMVAPEWEAADRSAGWSAETDEVSADDEDTAGPLRRGWIAPGLVSAVVFGWTGFYVWAMQDRLLAAAPGEWIAIIRDWSVPVLLAGVILLIVTRNSRREALRFGNAARLLSDESARLEMRLSIVNRELSLAREFIAAQSRDLETLGRLAADRLSSEADRLQGLIRDNHARVEAIGTVSSAALDNMEKLRGQLPVIASSAKDVTNNIGNAGRTAHGQLQEMIQGFQKLNEFGQSSERQVQVLRGLVDETIAEYSRQTEQFGDLAAARFVEFRERSTEFRTQLDSDEIAALAAVRTRASAMAEELAQTRHRLDEDEAESLTSMRARLSALREEGAAISRALRDGESRALEGWQRAVERMREELQSALVALGEAEADATDASSARIAALGDDLARLERQLLDQAGRFTAESEKRHAAIAAAEEAAAARMRECFAALDQAANNRLQRHAEIDRAAAEELRERLAVLDNEIAARRAETEQFAGEAADHLRERFAMLDREMAERRAQHEAQGRRLLSQTEAITSRLAEFESRVTEIAEHGGATEAALAASLGALTTHLAESRSALSGADGEIAALTDASVRLLELIQASVKHSAEELPQALVRGETQLADIEGRMTELRAAAESTDARGANIARTIEAAGNALQRTYSELAELQAALEAAGSAHAQTLSGLRGELDAIAGESSQLAESTRVQLGLLLDELTRSTRTAISDLSENGTAAVAALSRQLGADSKVAVERAMQDSAAATAGQLEQAVASAASVSREAAVQLRDQLAKVSELAGNLESRVAHARQRAEEQIGNDFTRRVALITESLNSNAIDIAKALSTDVADTAWAAYLRGDRGIFTRRAVNLITSSEAKTIVQIYERDREFHDHVSRYIHDFEAMLRQVLSARDGQALSVTLLSSDMGKLYVVLAQAIQRLRR